jgi:hypothetical protein
MTERTPVVWRTKLRSSIEGVDWSQQVQHCLDNGLVGIGWDRGDLPATTTLDEMFNLISGEESPGWGVRAAQCVRRLGSDAVRGDFVWTRNTNGRYLLAQITGPYRYDGSAAARAVDVHQVRDVEWLAKPMNDLDVPGAVVRAFTGRGSSFSRVHDVGARRLTEHLWERSHGREHTLPVTPAEVLSSYLDPYDVEDLVFVWLQLKRGLLVLPRARQRDTPVYEWTLIDRHGGDRAIVQVKTGDVRVDLEALAAATTGEVGRTYAFSATGRYDGDRDVVTEVITSESLLHLAAARPDVLPPRVRSMFELAGAHVDDVTGG